MLPQSITDICGPDRVESEHIGHADQYRVTRDIPLPYSFDNGPPHDNSDDEMDHATDDKMTDHARSDAAGVHTQSGESFVGRAPVAT